MKQRTIFIAAIALLAILFAVGVGVYQSQKNEQATQTVADNSSALTRFHAVSMGNDNAPVHIVEFFDPACESCRAFYPFVKQLMEQHAGKIKLTIRYAPFHRGADEVVKVLESARKQGKYWETLEAVLAAQPQWAPDHTAHLDLLWPHIGGLGLDMERLKEDMKSPELTRLIQQDMADVKALNVTGTPEFFVNGRPLPSFGPKQLQMMVEEELAAAEAGKAS